MLREVRYPDVQVRIWEEHPGEYGLEDDEPYSVESPDASRILERVCIALRESGVGDEEIELYTKEATSRCYNHLLFTTMQWVRIHWDFPGTGATGFVAKVLQQKGTAGDVGTPVTAEPLGEP